MDLSPTIQFKKKSNSLLVASLLKKDLQSKIETEVDLPNENITNNLGMISGLYIYTNTPPHGYGSQGPKVAETVLRAYSYNLKKSNKVLKLSHLNIERLNWEEEDGNFPEEETHGNFLPSDVKNMAIDFLINNVSAIDQCVNKVVEKTLHMNSDILTKGRQTLDCFTHQSVTASVAYKRMYDFYNRNLDCGTLSCFEWIKSYFEVMNKQTIYAKTIVETKDVKYIYNNKTKQRLPKEVIHRTIKEVKIEGEMVKAKVLDFSRSFASYIKHKERGKLNRRAIASANMILRMFLYIIEEFHLELGKIIEGSTISIGGEEKKAKIINNLGKVFLPNQSTVIELQGTEDATKWNECLSPAVFAIMHKTFFDNEIRKAKGIQQTSEYGELFSLMAVSAHFIMAVKRIQMGPGPIAENSECYNRLDWLRTPIERFNQRTQEWLLKARPYIDEENYLNASPGMLMGMLNAGSTTLGLLAVGYGLNKTTMQNRSLRSSDDSTTIYTGTTIDDLIQSIEINRRALSAIGINLSLEKTFFYDKYFSEYTSWYQDQGFVSQFGVETSAIRPQGKNPPDDFYSIAKGTATGLSTLTLNHIGATMRLTLGIEGVRRIWRIKKDPLKRDGISPDVLVLADGGLNLWDSCNCHLEEISLRERKSISQEDKEYLLRICNPNNPFCAEPTEEVSYSKEIGKLVTTEIETPRTVFHYVKRSNRTVNNSIKKDMFNQEKINSEVSKIVKAIIPTTLVRYPTDSTLISRQLTAALAIYRSRVELSEAQQEEYNRALEFLKYGKKDDESIDNIDIYSDDDL